MTIAVNDYQGTLVVASKKVLPLQKKITLKKHVDIRLS
jgi:hypothetical protein